jgi:hypothetical protein
MRKVIITKLQNFINRPFTYQELLSELDNTMDYLLEDFCLDKMPEDEYNALWDCLFDMEKYFKFADNPNLVIASNLSVSDLFFKNIGERNPNSKEYASYVSDIRNRKKQPIKRT